ncbi:MAG: helix-turn-helix transcriptional regulator [Rhizobiaceae bacterium]|nr:helix-turn-helix transcriptional regulator [Rhizobiaceae bacterium]
MTIDAIYAAADRSGDWDRALALLADSCAMAGAALVHADPALHLAEVSAPRADPAFVAAYGAHWWSLDPTIPATMSAPVGHVTSLATSGRDRFLRSEFHNEYWRNSGFGAERLASNLVLADGAFASIVVQAASHADELTEHAGRRFALLLPHLMRALRVQRKLLQLDMARLVLDVPRAAASDTVLIVDGIGRLMLDLPVAADLPPGLRIMNNRVCHADPRIDDALRRLIHSCAPGATEIRGGHLDVPCRPGSARRIEIVPTRAPGSIFPFGSERRLALVIIPAAQPDEPALIEVLRAAHGLTMAEAKVMLRIGEGHGREAAAMRLGISLSTLRTHLSRVFEKTGTRRQAELAGLVARSRTGRRGR